MIGQSYENENSNKETDEYASFFIITRTKKKTKCMGKTIDSKIFLQAGEKLTSDYVFFHRIA